MSLALPHSVSLPFKHMLNMEFDLQCLFELLCTAALRPRNSPLRLGSYTRALLVSRGRRHLFVTPCLVFTTVSLPSPCLSFFHLCSVLALIHVIIPCPSLLSPCSFPSVYLVLVLSSPRQVLILVLYLSLYSSPSALASSCQSCVFVQYCPVSSSVP
jgi:hypothetical protein